MRELTGDDVREMAMELYESTNWQRHPCQKGVGECCESKVPVTKHDQWVIEKAVDERKIPPKIIEAAKIRVLKGTNKCGFLNESGSCTIYQSRPAICMFTGTGAEQDDRYPEVIDAIQYYVETGIDIMVPAYKTISTMCGRCHAEMINRGEGFPASVILLFQRAAMYYRFHANMPINDFIKRIKR